MVDEDNDPNSKYCIGMLTSSISSNFKLGKNVGYKTIKNINTFESVA